MYRKLTKKEWCKVAQHIRKAAIHLNIARDILSRTTSKKQSFGLNVLSKSMNSTIEWILRTAQKQGKITNKLIKILDIEIKEWRK